MPAAAQDQAAVTPAVRGVLAAKALALYLRLDETAGAVAADSSGNHRDGAIAGGVTLGQPGPLAGDPQSGAMLFNGIDGKVTVPYDAAFSSATQTMGAWIWFAANPPGNAAIVVNGNAALSTGVRLELTSLGKVLYLVKPSNVNITTSLVLAPAQWHRVIGTYDGANLRVYVDGVLRGGPTVGAMTPNTTQEVRVGQPISSAAFWTGLLKGIVLGPGVWTAADVADDWQVSQAALGGLAAATDSGVGSAAAADRPATTPAVRGVNAGKAPVGLWMLGDVPGANLVPDPGFEAADLSAWATSNLPEWSQPADPYAGVKSALCTRTNLGPNNWNQLNARVPPDLTVGTGTHLWPVVPGTSYLLSVRSKQTAGVVASHFKVTWFNAAGAGLGNVQPMSGQNGVKPWTLYWTVWLAPATAVYAQVAVMAGWWDAVNGANAQTNYDEVYVQPLAFADLGSGNAPAYPTGQVSTGQPSLYPGDPGAFSASFPSSTTYAEAATPWDPSGNNPWSIATWWKPNTVDAQFRRIAGKEPASNHGAILAWHAGSLFYYIGRGDAAGGIDTAGGGNPVVGVPAHLCGTYDGANLRMYVDGVLVATTPSVRVCDVGAAPLRIGGTLAGGGTVGGTAQGLGVWNRQLSTAEVADLAKAGQVALGGYAAALDVAV